MVAAMPKAPATNLDFIKALGGIDEVAATLEKTPRAVKAWALPDRGIPWKYRKQVEKLAKQKRVPIPEDFWQAA